MSEFGNVRVWGIGPVVHGVKGAVRFVLWELIEACLRSMQTVVAGREDNLYGIFTATLFAVGDKP